MSSVYCCFFLLYPNTLDISSQEEQENLHHPITCISYWNPLYLLLPPSLPSSPRTFLFTLPLWATFSIIIIDIIYIFFNIHIINLLCTKKEDICSYIEHIILFYYSTVNSEKSCLLCKKFFTGTDSYSLTNGPRLLRNVFTYSCVE
jgi:hypothetical protein